MNQIDEEIKILFLQSWKSDKCVSSNRKQGQKVVHKNVSQGCRLCISQTLFFHNVQRYLFLQSINNKNRRKSDFLNKKVSVCALE